MADALACHLGVRVKWGLTSTRAELENLDLSRLIVKARPWLPLMVVAVLLFAATAFVVSSIQQKVYEARTTLIVGQALSAANPDYSQLLVAQDLSATYAAVAKTRPILEQLIDDLKLEVTPEELSAKVQVDAPGASTLLFPSLPRTRFRHGPRPSRTSWRSCSSPPRRPSKAERRHFRGRIDEDLAATQDLIDASQARADALVALEVRTAEQEAELQALEARLTSLRSTYATLLSFSSGTATNLLTVIEPAEAPTSPVLPRTLLNTLLAAALGLLVILGIAFLKEQLDDSMKDPEAVEEVTGLSTLGTIAKWKVAEAGARSTNWWRSSTHARPPPRATAPCARISTSPPWMTQSDPPRGECRPRRGKDHHGLQLAVIFAQSGRKVVLVHADTQEANSTLDVRPAQYPRSNHAAA